MMKPILLLFLGVFSYSFIANASLECQKLFKPQNIEYKLSTKSVFTNPYAQDLFSSVYMSLSFLKTELSDSELKFYINFIEQTINLLENSSDHLGHSMHLMERFDLSKAIKAFPDIIHFLKSDQVSKHEFLDKQTILKLIVATFSQHLWTYFTHPSNKLDWARFERIIKSIAHFESQPNVFSLYKIQRVIKEKYSLKEYISCL